MESILSAVDLTPTDQPELTEVNGRPPSAVLVTIYDGVDGPEFLFTRRAWHLRSHTGEISFPGGRQEPADANLTETALRETEEEIGLHRSKVEVVGELDRLTTVSSPAAILPVVGLLDGEPRNLTVSAGEVDAIVTASVRELMNPEVYREEIWTRDDSEIEITFFELKGDTLWGATARIVRSLLERL